MPPDTVLIHCHDLGKYVGCYDAGVETPRIDGLAAAGVRFDRHFVTAPQCSPSRSSLMTGRHPHQNGMLGLAHGNWEVDPHERFLPALLGEAGFWHLPAVYMTTDVSCGAAGREVQEESYGEQRPYEELYDLEADPLERENLAAGGEPDDSATATVRNELREELLEWMDATGDPLLEGPVLPNNWETIHPRLADERDDSWS